MMNLVFVKRYNPAYDIFLTSYLKEGGIIVSAGKTWQRTLHKLRILSEKENKTPHEELYVSYLRSWTYHPETRPGMYHLIQRLLPHKKTEVEELKELESRLLPGEGKLIFSKRDIAKELSDFYRNYMTKPLESDLARGADSDALSEYFNIKELESRPKVRRESGPERMYEEDKKTATELLTWLTRITVESVLKDLDDIFEAHFNAPDHMRDGKLIPGSDVKVKRCEHWSEYLWLTCQRELDEAEVFLTLRPTRGMGLIELGFQEVQFPEYYVKMVEAQ